METISPINLVYNQQKIKILISLYSTLSQLRALENIQNDHLFIDKSSNEQTSIPITIELSSESDFQIQHIIDSTNNTVFVQNSTAKRSNNNNVQVTQQQQETQSPYPHLIRYTSNYQVNNCPTVSRAMLVIGLAGSGCSRVNPQIRDLAFIYFIAKLLGRETSLEMVKRLLIDYIQTREYMDLSSESNLNSNEDFFVSKRKLMQARDDISNLKEKFLNYHIVLRSFFDSEVDDYETLDPQFTENAYLQIWSNLSRDFGVYNNHINHQQNFLFHKIAETIKRENLICESENTSIQNIILIGKSQTGKSSLIEHLTQLKGLRGNGTSSCTLYCKIHMISDGQTQYRFIDPPGHFSSNSYEDEFHGLKILIDFMRRKKILNFKIIFLYRGNKCISPTVYEKFFTFIIKYLDQDVSQVLEQQINLELDQQFLSEEILQYLRSSCLSIKIKNFNNTNEVIAEEEKYQNSQKPENIQNQFDLKFGTNPSINKIVHPSIDHLQLRLLFTAIQNTISFTLEDILAYKVKLLQNARLIEEHEDIIPIFQELFIFCKKILKVSDYSTINQEQLARAIVENNRKIYLVMTNKWDQIVSFLSLACQNENIDPNKELEMRKMMKRRFLQINYSPILFECKSDNPNVLLSRQQQFYSMLKNSFKDFLFDDEFFIQMSSQMVKTDLILQWHLFQKMTDKYYHDEKFDCISQTIQISLATFSLIQGAGIQIYRYATFFSKIEKLITEGLQSAQRTAKLANIGGAIASGLSCIASIGFDLYYFHTGQISTGNLIFNSFFNSIAAMSLFASFFIPGVGIAVGIGAGLIALAGQIFSGLIFTCSSTFEETIRLFMMDMVDNQLENQNLQLFQRNQFLREQFQITKTSDLSSYLGKNAFRELEKNKTQTQKNLLSRLHNVENESATFDIVANYILKTFILAKFNKIPQKNQCLEFKQYQQQIIETIQSNQQLCDVFLNRFTNKGLKNTFKNLLKQIKKQKNLNYQFDDNMDEQINQYNEELEKMLQQLSNTQFTKAEIEEYSNGYFRKADRFKIIFNSYSNLMDRKTKFIYSSQTLIKEIQKGQGDICFKINPIFNYKTIFEDNVGKKISVLDDFQTRNFTSSRYLNKLEGSQTYQFTFLSPNELFGGLIKQSIDLYVIAQSSSDLVEFIHQLKSQIYGVDEQNMNELMNRATSFYKSYKQMKQLQVRFQSMDKPVQKEK